MSKLHVAVIRGGPSHEYPISLKTGAAVLRHMPEEYQAHDIFIDQQGTWHRDGLERMPERALTGIDVAYNALHGYYGEDGKIQKLLGTLGIPYTGSEAVASSLGMNKFLTKEILSKNNIKTPYHTVIHITDDIQEKTRYLFNHFFLPFIIKPIISGSSFGITLVKNFQDIQSALEHAFQYAETALIEEYIKGTEASCGVIDNFRGEKTYSLLPAEIRHGKDFYDFDSKYGQDIYHKVPGNLSQDQKLIVQNMAKQAHNALGARHYSRSDFIVHPRRGVYLLEVNTLPTLIPESIFTHSLEAVGSSLPEFLRHIITEAYTNTKY